MYKGEDIREFQDERRNNILKSFGLEISENNLEKAHQDGDMHPNGKWVWRSSANGGKGDWRVAISKRSSSSKESIKDDNKKTETKKLANSYFVKVSKMDLDDAKKELTGKSVKFEVDPKWEESTGKKDARSGKTYKIEDVVEGNGSRGQKMLMIKTDIGYFPIKNINANKYDHASKISFI